MSAGKGDSPRRVNGSKYREGYDRIFRKPIFAIEPYVFDGPELKKPKPREFMKVNQEADE